MSPVQVNYFTITRDLKKIYFQIIKLHGSMIVWIGDSTKSFDNLALSVITKYEKFPLSINMIGDGSNFTAQNLAKKIVKKTGQQVYVSYNLAENEDTEKFIEEHLFEKLRTDFNALSS